MGVSLVQLELADNQISDISPLANLTSLTNLWLNDNQINDISSLANLTSLTWPHLEENQISDISALSSLINLIYLHLQYNEISDINPPVQNEGLGDWDFVGLEGNPLRSDSINVYIPQLEARGVDVFY